MVLSLALLPALSAEPGLAYVQIQRYDGNPEGGRVVRLSRGGRTVGPKLDGALLAVLADGTMLATDHSNERVLRLARDGQRLRATDLRPFGFAEDPDRDDPVIGAALSPDGTLLAVNLQGGLVVVRAGTGEVVRRIATASLARRLKFEPGGYPLGDGTVFWSPDGGRLVYAAALDSGLSSSDGTSGPTTLVLDWPKGEPRRIARGGSAEGSPAGFVGGDLLVVRPRAGGSGPTEYDADLISRAGAVRPVARRVSAAVASRGRVFVVAGGRGWTAPGVVRRGLPPGMDGAEDLPVPLG